MLTSEINVNMPYEVLQDMHAVIHRYIEKEDGNISSKAWNALNTQMNHIIKVMHDIRLIKKAGDPIFEDDEMRVWEHPDLGDEAPLMGYCKLSKRFWDITYFWDADNPQEIREWMDAAL